MITLCPVKSGEKQTGAHIVHAVQTGDGTYTVDAPFFLQQAQGKMQLPLL